MDFVSLSVFRCSFFRFPFACFCVLELCGLIFFHFFLLLFSFSLFACFYVLTICHLFFVSLSFSLPFSPSASLHLQLVFLRRLYSSTVRLSSAGGSFSLVSTCSPSSPTPSSACCLCDLRLSSAPVSLHFLSSFPFRFLAFCCCFGSLSLPLSPSRVFSPSLVTLSRVASQFCLHSFVVFSSYAPASFSMRRRGGGLQCCSFSVSRKGDTPMFVSSTLRGVCSLVLLSVFLCHSIFALLSSIARCPVLASLLRFFFLLFFFVVCCLRLSSGSPVFF